MYTKNLAEELDVLSTLIFSSRTGLPAIIISGILAEVGSVVGQDGLDLRLPALRLDGNDGTTITGAEAMVPIAGPVFRDREIPKRMVEAGIADSSSSASGTAHRAGEQAEGMWEKVNTSSRVSLPNPMRTRGDPASHEITNDSDDSSQYEGWPIHEAGAVLRSMAGEGDSSYSVDIKRDHCHELLSTCRNG